MSPSWTSHGSAVKPVMDGCPRCFHDAMTGEVWTAHSWVPPMERSRCPSRTGVSVHIGRKCPTATSEEKFTHRDPFVTYQERL